MARSFAHQLLMLWKTFTLTDRRTSKTCIVACYDGRIQTSRNLAIYFFNCNTRVLHRIRNNWHWHLTKACACKSAPTHSWLRQTQCNWSCSGAINRYPSISPHTAAATAAAAAAAADSMYRLNDLYLAVYQREKNARKTEQHKTT